MMRRNVLANAVGQAFAVALSLIAVPLYIHYLGVEAYGLVAFFASLQAILSVLDLGLGTTANREVAAGIGNNDRAAELRDLVRTLEVFYVGVGVLIALLIIGGAGWIIDRWIAEATLSRGTLYLALIVFAISLGVRWPVSLYTGVLLGAERQVALNGATIVVSLVRTAGAIVVVALISRSLLGFIVWYLISNAIEVAVMARLAWSVLPRAPRAAQVRPRLMQHLWRFSASVSGNSLLAAGLKQGDRLLITRLLPLRFLGYYAASNAAGTALSMLVRPFATAALPRFSALLARNENERLAATYHKLSQSVAIAVAPIASVFIFFAHDILRVWTRNADVAANGSTTFAVFGFAYLLNALMQVPFALQLAAGITWIAITNNAISVAVLLPAMYFLIKRFGIEGAGVSWAIFNTVYFLVIPHVMHRYVLRGELKRWFLGDTVPFLIIALTVGYGVRLVRDSSANALTIAAAAVAGGMLYVGAVILLSPVAKQLLSEALRNLSSPAPRTGTGHVAIERGHES